MRTAQNYASLYMKGVAMGMVDVVPGISGGTIAFITGIYEELIHSIKCVNWEALRLLKRRQFAFFWKKINGSFLFAVLAGIATSIISLARLTSWLLHEYPIFTWSFFFGLIIASIPFILREVKWSIQSIAAGIAGIGVAYWITVAAPIQLPSTPFIIFLCGTLAICAMVLPGISGAFILLLLGQYEFLIQAIGHFDVSRILTFATGCIVGLLLFTRLLSWVLTHYRFSTLTLLAGFTLGSLNKVWPWKYALAFQPDQKTPVLSQNIWPTEYLCKTGHNPQLLYAILLASLGILIVIFVEKFASSLKAKP